MSYRTLALIAVALLAPATALSAHPKQVDALSGLVPAGFVPQDAAAPPTAEALGGAMLAVVASANLEALTRQWVDYYERGGREKQQANFAVLGTVMGGAGMAGAAAGAQQGLQVNQQHGGAVRDATDPRSFSDQAVAALAPYFGEVIVAPDLATAFEQQAQYVAVLDFYGTLYPPFVTNRYRSEANVHVFDATLQRVLLVQGKFDGPLEGYWSLIPQSVIAGQASTFGKGLRVPTEAVVAQIREKLGPPPARPAPAPDAAPAAAAPTSLAQCIDLCKANTSRTPEQCFDACNK